MADTEYTINIETQPEYTLEIGVLPGTINWGVIEGLLSLQTDLQSALNEKYDSTNFVAGTDYLAPSGDGSSLTDLNGSEITSGTVGNSYLSSNVTLQGNTFNGNSQLVQTTSDGKLPAIDGSQLTNVVLSTDTVISLGTISSGTATLTKDKFHTVTFSGAATIALPTELTSGVHYNCSLLVTMSSVVTITQPTVTWAYGTTPALTSTSVKYRITYETIDGGTTWYGYWTQLGA